MESIFDFALAALPWIAIGLLLAVLFAGSNAKKRNGEQRDEYETLPVVKDGKEIRFRHKNGRTFFCEQYNPKNREYTIPEKIRKALLGKTIEQQMEYYYVTESARLYATAYGEITDDALREHAVRLCDYEGVRKLLLKDGILVGARIAGHWGEDNLLPESRVCTYYASDNEGSGTKEREDYAYLIFKEKI